MSEQKGKVNGAAREDGLGRKKLKNKKLLFIITQTKWGGAQKYVLELAEYFSKNNEVHIAYGEVKNPNKQFLNKCKKLKIKTIPVKNLKRSIDVGYDVAAVIEIFKDVLNNANYDLIHLNSSKVGLLGALAGKLYGFNPINTRLRIIYTAHGFVFNEPKIALEKKLFTFSEMFSTGLQTMILTVSDYDKQSAVDNKVCPEWKMIPIHNGIDPLKYDFLSQEKARQELDLEMDKKYFGTIASFYETKGYSFLLEAIDMLKQENSSLIKNYRWVFIGTGPGLQNIQDKAKELKIDKYIKFVDPKDDDWKYLKAFDVFVLPSVKEGLPYTILESGLAGVPVIASKVGGIPEILSHEATGYMTNPANALSLKEAMRRLAKDNELSAKLSKNNEENIRQNFSLEKMINKTEESYLKLF